MSWIRDTGGDLINLDHVASIVLVEDDDNSEGTEVLAYVNDETAYTLFTGRTITAKEFITQLEQKLPRIRL